MSFEKPSASGQQVSSIRGAIWQQAVRWRSIAIPIAVCVLGPILLVSLQIASNDEFSPFDEAAHLDYVERISGLEVPRQGDLMLESSMRNIACNGYQGESFDHLPDCDSPRGSWPDVMKWTQHEAQQPPTYYALTVPLRWAAHNIAGIENDLRATRTTSIVWLVTGLLLLWTAGRLMAIPPLILGAALLILASSPLVLYLSATVSNDVTAVPAAGLVALAAALAYRQPGRWTWLLLFGAGFAASALKSTNFLATATVALLFAAFAVSRREEGELFARTVRRWLPTGGALIAGGMLATAIWAGVHSSIALISLSEEPALDALRQGSRSPGTVLSASVSLIWPLTGDPSVTVIRDYSPESLGRDVLLPFYALLAIAPLAIAFSALFVRPRRWPHSLGLIALAVLCAAGLVFAVGLMVLYAYDPTPDFRLGLSTAPLFLLAFVAALVGRWSRIGFTAFAVMIFVTTLGALIA